MENRKRAEHAAARPGVDCFGALLFLFLTSFLFAACGAPGEPTPPSPPIPTAVTDLTARQSGDGALLTLTLPTRTVTNERLIEPPSVEIFRGSLKPDGKPDNKSFQLVYTLPGALLDTYTTEKHIQFKDPINPNQTLTHPGATYAYRVRTRAAKKKDSADSNTVALRIFSVPEKIVGLETKVTEPAIELTWTAPKKTSGGAPL